LARAEAKMVNIVEKIRQLAESVHSRGNDVDHSILEIVEDWLNHNESGIAIDDIVDRVVEFDIPITLQDLGDIVKIYEALQCEMRASVECLSKLVID
jgi:hypothetical protein